jgi:hypothetical protein
MNLNDIYEILFSIKFYACNLMWPFKIKIISPSLFRGHFFAPPRKSCMPIWGAAVPTLGNADKNNSNGHV